MKHKLSVSKTKSTIGNQCLTQEVFVSYLYYNFQNASNILTFVNMLLDKENLKVLSFEKQVI